MGISCGKIRGGKTAAFFKLPSSLPLADIFKGGHLLRSQNVFFDLFS